MQKKLILVLLVIVLAIIPPVSAIRPHYIYDNANVVSDSMEKMINELSGACDTTTTAEIVIVTLPSLPQGKSVEETKLYYFNDVLLDGVKGIGKVGKNNGVLILLVMDSHDWAIETGYGVEGQLTDAECGRIGRDVMTPYFKEGKFGDGLFRGVQSVATELGYGSSITYVETTGSSTTTQPIDENLLFVLLIIAIIIAIVVCYILIMSDSDGYSSGSSHSSSSGRGGRGGFGGGGSGGGGGRGKWNIPAPMVVAPLVGVAAFLAGKKTLSELTPDGIYMCPKCEKETAYAKDYERTSEELLEDGVYKNINAKYLCLVCGNVYSALLSSVLIEKLEDYKQRIVREEEEAEERAKKQREEAERARQRRETERKRQDDSYHRSSYDSGSSHSGGSSFGGGSSGGGGARGKW